MWNWTTMTSGLLCDFHPGPVIAIRSPPMPTRQTDQLLVVGLVLIRDDLHVGQPPLDIRGPASGTRGARDGHHRSPQGYMTPLAGALAEPGANGHEPSHLSESLG
jgi:hypothetical protein